MATYYRWRKSDINYTEITEEVSDFHFTRGDLKLWYSNSKPDIVPNSNGYGRYHFNKYMVISRPDTPVAGLFFSDLPDINLMYKGDTNARASAYDDGSVATHIQIIGNAVSYRIKEERGDKIGYVYSTNINSYPRGGMTKGYWYDQRTTVTSPTAPSGLSYPATITTPSVEVTWTAATSNVPNYPVRGYQVDVSTNGGTSWTLAGNPNTNSLTYSITPGVTSIMFRVRAKDSNGQWGSYVTGTSSQVLLAPTLTVPRMLMQGQPATINWTAITGADSYTLQRKSSADADWTQVYSGANTTFSETAGTWTTVQYRVQAVKDGTPGGWATSAEIPVVSASALVISGQDGDLGTLVNDVPYTISTDTGNQITATITANGAVIFSGTVGNSTAGVIPVLDLINGAGTIVIEASVTASSGPVSAVRTWTYTKTMMTFPNAGSIAELTKDGKVMWPETLAEAVRIPGGKTLDQVMGFPAQVYTGSYVGTGTYGADNPTEITFPFVPDLWGVIGVYLENSECFYVQGGSKGSGYQPWLIPWGMQHFRGDTSVTADMMTASYDGSTISFYNANSTDQWNYEGRIYYFIGIKIG